MDSNNTIYSATITGAGPAAATFAEQGMLVTFGDGAPEMLKEFCYFLTPGEVSAPIEPGHLLRIGDKDYEVTAVGDVAAQNLGNLGHLTVVFNGATTPHLPGAINVAGGGVAPAAEAGAEFSIRARA